jgi:thiamine transport system substrate-binding protein
MAAVAALAMLAAACGGTDGGGTDGDGTAAPTASAPETTSEQPDLDGTTVTLLTHDSFNASEEVLAAFEDETGMTLEILRSGDAGSMVNQAILSAGNPQADVLFGIDNTFLSRALEADLFDAYEPPAAADLDQTLVLDDQYRVSPVDTGDVCLNYDREAFDDLEVAPPTTLEDLTDPAYAGMLVVENPATSSPGLAFLLATVATFGTDGWQPFWEDLRTNDVAVSAGWEDAYYGQFSGGAGEGDRPLVVSYASSPPAEVYFADPQPDQAPTGVIAASCFRQIEFAGILAGTDNRAGAEALIDFLLSVEFQEDIPLNMFVFPARTDAQLPDVFLEHAEPVEDPIEMDPAEIDANREAWIDEWTQIVIR